MTAVLVSWLDLYLLEIFSRASLVQEKSQFPDFASSTGITAKICNVFCDQIVGNRFCLRDVS